MRQHNSFICDLCGKVFTSERSVLNHKAAGHQDPVKRLASLSIGRSYGITEDLVGDAMRESIIKLKSENRIKPWDWENICRLILKPSQDLYHDYKLLKNTTHHNLEWYVILYGDTKGKEMHSSWVNTLKSLSPSNPEYYLKQGIAEEDSHKLSKIKHKERSQKGGRAAGKKLKGSSLYTVRSTAYWVAQGYSYAEAKLKVREIQDTRSLRSVIKRHGPKGELLYRKTIEKWKHSVKLTCIDRGHWICPSKKTAWQNYQRSVINITKQSYKDHIEQINPNGKTRGKGWELDHRYSVAEGFRNNIDPNIIGHWTNLEVIDHKLNSSKWTKCSLTLEQLTENYRSNRRIY